MAAHHHAVLQRFLRFVIRFGDILHVPITSAYAYRNQKPELPLHNIQNVLEDSQCTKMVLLFFTFSKAENNRSRARSQIDGDPCAFHLDHFFRYVAQHIGI
ncbi:hypothetical protein D3C73_1044390 [compost metagenome]